MSVYQCDQVGRLFANWATFGVALQRFRYKSCPYLGDTVCNFQLFLIQPCSSFYEVLIYLVALYCRVNYSSGPKLNKQIFEIVYLQVFL